MANRFELGHAGHIMDLTQIDFFSEAFQEDPYPTYAALRDEHPVFRESRYGVYVLTRFEDVDAALRDQLDTGLHHGGLGRPIH